MTGKSGDQGASRMANWSNVVSAGFDTHRWSNVAATSFVTGVYRIDDTGNFHLNPESTGGALSGSRDGGTDYGDNPPTSYAASGFRTCYYGPYADGGWETNIDPNGGSYRAYLQYPVYSNHPAEIVPGPEYEIRVLVSAANIGSSVPAISLSGTGFTMLSNDRSIAPGTAKELYIRFTVAEGHTTYFRMGTGITTTRPENYIFHPPMVLRRRIFALTVDDQGGAASMGVTSIFNSITVADQSAVAKQATVSVDQAHNITVAKLPAVAALQGTTVVEGESLTVLDQQAVASLPVVAIGQSHPLSVATLRALSNPGSTTVQRDHDVTVSDLSGAFRHSAVAIGHQHSLTVAGMSCSAVLPDTTILQYRVAVISVEVEDVPGLLPGKLAAPAYLDSTTLLVPFSVISVSVDDLVIPDEDDVEVWVSSAGDVMGKVFWGGIEQPIKSWTNDMIIVGPTNAVGKTPGVQYAWDVWKPL